MGAKKDAFTSPGYSRKDCLARLGEFRQTLNSESLWGGLGRGWVGMGDQEVDGWGDLLECLGLESWGWGKSTEMYSRLVTLRGATFFSWTITVLGMTTPSAHWLDQNWPPPSFRDHKREKAKKENL